MPRIFHPADYYRKFMENMEKNFMGIFVEEEIEKLREEHKEM